MGIRRKEGPVTNVHWKISKPLGSISCRQFKKLARAFEAAATEVYGAPPVIEITTMGQDTSKYKLDKVNDLNLLKKADWATNKMVEVTFRPAVESEGLEGARGLMRCYFNKAGIAFFMETAGKEVRSVKTSVIAAKPLMCMAIDV